MKHLECFQFPGIFLSLRPHFPWGNHTEMVAVFVSVTLLADYLFSVIIRHLKDKPTGLQTFLDILNMDLLRVIKHFAIYEVFLYDEI